MAGRERERKYVDERFFSREDEKGDGGENSWIGCSGNACYLLIKERKRGPTVNALVASLPFTDLLSLQSSLDDIERTGDDARDEACSCPRYHRGVEIAEGGYYGWDVGVLGVVWHGNGVEANGRLSQLDVDAFEPARTTANQQEPAERHVSEPQGSGRSSSTSVLGEVRALKADRV